MWVRDTTRFGYSNGETGEFISELRVMQDPKLGALLKSQLANQFNAQLGYSQQQLGQMQQAQLQNMLGMGGLVSMPMGVPTGYMSDPSVAANAIKALPGYERHKDDVVRAIKNCASDDPSEMFKAAKQAILVADQRYIAGPHLSTAAPFSSISEFDWLRKRVKEILWHPSPTFA